MSAGRRVDELGRNADPLGRFAHTALQHISHAEILTHLLHLHGLPLITYLPSRFWRRVQASLEERLFAQRSKTKPVHLFWYDVTRSYLEGPHNDLAAFGDNREGKKGKLQIVMGLLCDEDGHPVSIEVFPGHTPDPHTLAAQLAKGKPSFGVTAITFVGDRGMIKGQQIEDLATQGFHSITAITKPQIDKLLRTGVFHMDLFAQEVAEVLADEGIRYVLRRNPVRAQEVRDTR